MIRQERLRIDQGTWMSVAMTFLAAWIVTAGFVTYAEPERGGQVYEVSTVERILVIFGELVVGPSRVIGGMLAIAAALSYFVRPQATAALSRFALWFAFIAWCSATVPIIAATIVSPSWRAVVLASIMIGAPLALLDFLILKPTGLKLPREFARNEDE